MKIFFKTFAYERLAKNVAVLKYTGVAYKFIV